MGCPLYQQADRSAAPAGGTNCPEGAGGSAGGRAQPRPPPSWRPGTLLHPSMEELGSGDANWSEWTRSIRRSLRQRAEVFHTQAPAAQREAPSEPESPERQASQAEPEELAASEEGGSGKRKRGGARHKYSLRLGYDPRVFLEDPALRGQQLTPEAEAWAREFRARLPMASDLQLSRRLEPEPLPQPARGSQQARAPAAGGSAGRGAEQLPALLSSSEDEAGVDENAFRVWGRHLAARARARRPPDDPPVTLYVLERLAEQPAAGGGGGVQERLSRVGEAISAASRELHNRPDWPALPARDRERMIQWHSRRVERLRQLQAEWPLPGEGARVPLDEDRLDLVD